MRLSLEKQWPLVYKAEASRLCFVNSSSVKKTVVVHKFDWTPERDGDEKQPRQQSLRDWSEKSDRIEERQ